MFNKIIISIFLANFAFNLSAMSQHELNDALIMAVTVNNIELTKELIEKKANINIKFGEFHTTLLHYAIMFGSQDLAELLILKGADINTKDNRKNTPLHKAALCGKFDVTKLLLANKADVNAVNLWGCTPLHETIASGNKIIVELLLTYNSNPSMVNAKCHIGRTPLHFLATNINEYQSNKNIIKLLLDRGAYINAQEDRGNTPLVDAVVWNRKNNIELLLEHGADKNLKNNDGMLAADLTDNSEAKMIINSHMQMANR